VFAAAGDWAILVVQLLETGTVMAGKVMIYVSVGAIVALTYFGWRLTARGAYESAEYTVLDSDGPFEIREYPDLIVATTNMKSELQGDDGSFMRLLRYISGANDQETKIAMTTPVFMDAEAGETQVQMGFVIPKKVTEQRIPTPSNDDVRIRKRFGGRFAVIRFSGRIKGESYENGENRLRNWMNDRGLVGDGDAEFAGYDPPWTPGPLRRNEILIRLK
jgi:hypothetical protein